MKTMIIYDSVFGNTERIAQAMGTALGAETARVGTVGQEQLAGVGLLIVGSPTRGFRPTEATQAFLKGLPAGALAGVKVAAFDTRIEPATTQSAIYKFMAKFFGYAAGPIAKALEKQGGNRAAAPEGFVVQGSEGPLKEGELERAAAWAIALNR